MSLASGRILRDEEIVAAVYEALAKRHPKSRSRGRPAAPAEMVLRLPFGEGLIAEEVSDLREEWMTHAQHLRMRRIPDVERATGALWPSYVACRGSHP
jgi:hypothetical protein